MKTIIMVKRRIQDFPQECGGGGNLCERLILIKLASTPSRTPSPDPNLPILFYLNHVPDFARVSEIWRETVRHLAVGASHAQRHGSVIIKTQQQSLGQFSSPSAARELLSSVVYAEVLPFALAVIFISLLKYIDMQKVKLCL